MPDRVELIVLDWQHPAYRFSPGNQALMWQAEWTVPVYPNGDYYAFLSEDYSAGTFGHPWEQTICVMGNRLIESLGRSWALWLPIKRRNELVALDVVGCDDEPKIGISELTRACVWPVASESVARALKRDLST